jgi:O-antigen ligase
MDAVTTLVVPRPTAVLSVVIAVVGVSLLAVRSLELALLACGALVFAIVVVTAPHVILAVALPMSYAIWRVGPDSLNMSEADASLVVATLIALPYVPWRDRRLQRVLFAVLAYELLILAPVLAHPTGRALFEYGHRAVLIAGPIFVGAALVNLNALRLALRTFLFGSCLISVAAIADTLSNGFGPAYPFGFQKNAVGNVLAVAVLVFVIGARLLELPPTIVIGGAATVSLGLLAVQSRGSLLSVVVCFALWTLRGRTKRPGSAVAIVLLVVAFAGTVSLINDREVRHLRVDPAAAQFSPEASRVADYDAALAVWRQHPLWGAGLRYFNEGGQGEAHNLVINALAESGLFGVAALAVLWIGAFAAIARLRGTVATLARLALLTRVLSGLVDIFWVGGRMTVPFVLVGAAIALDAQRRAGSVGLGAVAVAA